MSKKEKQSKERLLVKRLSRSFFKTRSFFKSFSQSQIADHMTDSTIERASSSVADSEISERELQRSIRETLEEQESSDALINHYVSRMFQTYVEHSIKLAAAGRLTWVGRIVGRVG
jgi:hypothetical protein